MKAAIVCGAPSSEFLAPYDDKSWEIWVLGNRADRHLDKRVSRIFEIHNHIDVSSPEQYKRWLVDHKIPLVVGETWDIEAPHVERFSYEESAQLYGSLYLTASPAYMISYALARGYTEIGLNGVDLSINDHEYFWQRPCMEAWIGFAKGRGVKVHIPEVSHVGKTKYCEGRDWNGKKKADGPFTAQQFLDMAAQHGGKISELSDQQYQIDLQIATQRGVQQAYEHLAKVARATEARIDVKSLSEATRLK